MDNRKYHLDINLHPKDEQPLFITEHKSIRERIASKLFGRKRQYLILIPSEAIDSISFVESKGGVENA